MSCSRLQHAEQDSRGWNKARSSASHKLTLSGEESARSILLGSNLIATSAEASPHAAQDLSISFLLPAVVAPETIYIVSPSLWLMRGQRVLFKEVIFRSACGHCSGPLRLSRRFAVHLPRRGFQKGFPSDFAVAALACPRNAHQKLSGEYHHGEGQLANGYPFWKRAGFGEEAYVYSGRNGKWHLGMNSREVCLQCVEAS